MVCGRSYYAESNQIQLRGIGHHLDNNSWISIHLLRTLADSFCTVAETENMRVPNREHPSAVLRPPAQHGYILAELFRWNMSASTVDIALNRTDSLTTNTKNLFAPETRLICCNCQRNGIKILLTYWHRVSVTERRRHSPATLRFVTS